MHALTASAACALAVGLWFRVTSTAPLERRQAYGVTHAPLERRLAQSRSNQSLLDIADPLAALLKDALLGTIELRHGERALAAILRHPKPGDGERFAEHIAARIFGPRAPRRVPHAKVDGYASLFRHAFNATLAHLQPELRNDPMQLIDVDVDDWGLAFGRGVATECPKSLPPMVLQDRW